MLMENIAQCSTRNNKVRQCFMLLQCNEKHTLWNHMVIKNLCISLFNQICINDI